MQACHSHNNRITTNLVKAFQDPHKYRAFVGLRGLMRIEGSNPFARSILIIRDLQDRRPQLQHLVTTSSKLS